MQFKFILFLTILIFCFCCFEIANLQTCFHEIKSKMVKEQEEPEPMCGARKIDRDRELLDLENAMELFKNVSKNSDSRGFYIDGCILSCESTVQGQQLGPKFNVEFKFTSSRGLFGSGIRGLSNIDNITFEEYVDKEEPRNFRLYFSISDYSQDNYAYLVIKHTCKAGSGYNFQFILLNLMNKQNPRNIFVYETLPIELCQTDGDNYCFPSEGSFDKAAKEQIIGKRVSNLFISGTNDLKKVTNKKYRDENLAPPFDASLIEGEHEL